MVVLCTGAFAAGKVKDANRAKPADVVEAETFLAKLPPACAETHAYASRDGTVSIRIICVKDGKTTNGLLVIKNGIVKSIE